MKNFMEDKWANNNNSNSDDNESIFSGLGDSTSEETGGGILSTIWKIISGGGD